MDKFYCNPAFIDSLISVNCSFIAQLQVTEISASVCGLNLPATKTGNVLNEAVKYIYIYFLFHFEWSLRLLNSEQSAKPILTGCLFFLFFSDPHISLKSNGAQKGSGRSALLWAWLRCTSGKRAREKLFPPSTLSFLTNVSSERGRQHTFSSLIVLSSVFGRSAVVTIKASKGDRSCLQGRQQETSPIQQAKGFKVANR